MSGTETDDTSPKSRGIGLELRLERGVTRVAMGPSTVGPGFDMVNMTMSVPATTAFDAGKGAAQFQHRLCDLERLELLVTEVGLQPLVKRLDLQAAGFSSLSLAVREGFIEVSGKLDDGVPFTCKAAPLAGGEGQNVEIVLYEPRLYGTSKRCAASIGAAAARAAKELANLVSGRLVAAPLQPILRRILLPLGWKVPRWPGVHLSISDVRSGAMRLIWERARLGVAEVADPDLLAAIEGARAFWFAERKLAEGDLPGARKAYLTLGPGAATHPFAVARRLALLSIDESTYTEALDLASAVLSRKPDLLPALLAKAAIHQARGEMNAAAAAFAQSAIVASERGEASSALTAAEACLALGPQVDRAARWRATEIVLAVQPDHLPALRTLLAIGEAENDREVILRACRKLTVHAPEAEEKALAHARLGELLLEDDPSSARLHVDNAVALAPAAPSTLSALARACEATGDHVRAVRTLDRLRDLAVDRGDMEAAERFGLEVVSLWERSGQLENALLRCRDVCQTTPSLEARERAALLAEQLGHFEEAIEHHTAAVATIAPGDPVTMPRLIASRRALARLAEERQNDPAMARGHVEELLRLVPDDPDGLRRLLRILGTLGANAERLPILDRLAVATADPLERSQFLAEAARLTDDGHDSLRRWRAVLADVETTGSALDSALSSSLTDEALEGISHAALALGDTNAEIEALERLSEGREPGPLTAEILDRHAAARARIGHIPHAFALAATARAMAPTLARIEAELRLARDLGDKARVTWLLGELARSLGGTDPVGAAHALMERARSLLASHDFDEALESAQVAARLAPDLPETHEYVAQLAENRNPPAAAAALLARADLAFGASEPDAADRMVNAGQAAIGAGLEEEGEAALRRALEAGIDKESARLAWEALVQLAVKRHDTAQERRALEALVPFLPTGERSKALLRASSMALEAGDLDDARAHAEAARAIAPREIEAVTACLAAAQAQKDDGAVAELLSAAAVLEAHRAGSLLRERALRLVTMGRLLEADDTFAQAAAALAPDRSVADEWIRVRKEGTGEVALRSWAEPLERYAERVEDRLEAARALREGANLALAQEDAPTALRCIRGAYSRTEDDPSFAGPLLAHLLYRMGSVDETLSVGRRLLATPLGDHADHEPWEAQLFGDLAELALESDDVPLALEALDRGLSICPHGSEMALRRFRIDPDRQRAVAALAETGALLHAARPKSEALAWAARSARIDLGDPARADQLFSKARTATQGNPALLVAVETLCVEAARADYDPSATTPPSELLNSLQNLRTTLEAVEDREGVEACLQETAELASRHGLVSEAVDAFRHLEEQAIARGSGADSARWARAAGLMLLEQGDPTAAEGFFRRALSRTPKDIETWRNLETAGRARGAYGTETRAEALLALADLDPCSAAIRREAAQLLSSLGRIDEARAQLELLVREDPSDSDSAQALADLLREDAAARAEVLRQTVPTLRGAEKAIVLQELAQALIEAGDEDGARAARLEAFEVCPSDRTAFENAREAARGDVDRLDTVLARRAAVVPEDSAECHRERALSLEAADQTDRAIEAWKAYLTQVPEDVDVMVSLAGKIARREGDGAAATLDAEIVSLAARKPQGVPAEAEAESRWRLGFSGSFDEGQETSRHLLRAIALTPRDHRAPRALSALAAAPDAAVDSWAGLEAARVVADSADDEHTRADALEAGARLSERSGDVAPEAAGILEALAVRRLGLEWNDATGRMIERAVNALREKGETPRVEALLARACQVTSGATRAAWSLRLADMAAERGDLSSARAARAEALAADPSNVALWTTHLADLERSGDTRGMAEALEKALNRPGADTVGLSFRLGRARASLGDEEAAERAFATVVDAGPTTPDWEEAARELSKRLEARGEHARHARVELALADASGLPAERLRLLLSAARAFDWAGDRKEAREVIQQAIDLEPDDPGPWKALADLSAAAGDRDAAARALLNLASRSDPQRGEEAAMEAAQLFESLGQPDDAKRALLAALNASPRSPRILRALAKRALAEGDRAEATRRLGAIDFLALDPEERVLHRKALAEITSYTVSEPSPVVTPVAAPPVSSELPPAESGGEGVPPALPPPLPDQEREVATEIPFEEADLVEDDDSSGAEVQEAPAAPTVTETQAEATPPVAIEPIQAVVSEEVSAIGSPELGEPHEPAPPTAKDAYDLPPMDLGAVDALPATDARGAITQGPVDRDQVVEPQVVEPAPAVDMAPVSPPAAPEPPRSEADRLRDLVEASSDKAERVAALHALGVHLAASPDSLEEAFGLLAEALSLDPSGTEAAAFVRDLGAAGDASRMDPVSAQAGRALLATGDATRALPLLVRAHDMRPEDVEVLRDLVAAAQTAGDTAELVRAGQELATLEAVSNPDGAVVRFLRLADLAAGPLSDPPLATKLLERAISISPSSDVAQRQLDRQRHENVATSFERSLARARESLLEPAVLSDLATTAREAMNGAPEREGRRRELIARIAEALAGFSSEAASTTWEEQPIPVLSGTRELVATPEARTATARLVALLAPWLETMFPADLSRRGVEARHRIGAHYLPDLAAIVEDARHSLGARACATFVLPGQGCEITIENTRPPAIVAGSGLRDDLSLQGARYMLARSLALIDLGWALVGKFAPRDVAIMCEIVCRFAGAVPSTVALPEKRARPYVEALARAVPREVAHEASGLAQRTALELVTLDTVALAAGIRQTASRIALTHSGNPASALDALLRTDSRLRTLPRSEALAHVDVRDLAGFALSDTYLGLRMAAQEGRA